MKWIDSKVRISPEGESVLITNHAYLDPANERYYLVAERNGEYYYEPETREALHTPDYWCEIEPPKK